MSDCANGGRGRWAGTEWTTPNGRTVFSDVRPTMLDARLTDGSVRSFPMALPDGVRVAGVAVDGLCYEPRRPRDFDEIDEVVE